MFANAFEYISYYVYSNICIYKVLNSMLFGGGNNYFGGSKC